jgi:tetratricopeptide (TPR) repeat protein
MTSPESPPTGRARSVCGSPTTITEPEPAAESKPGSVERAAALLRQGRFGEAAAAAHEILDQTPQHAEALYLAAVCERYQRRPVKALEFLARLHEARPGYARAYQEAGHNHRALARLPEARKAYSQAVALNPALESSWKNLAEIHSAQGNAHEAEAARSQFERLESLPRELLSVTSMLHEGRLYRAERLCRAWLQKHPRDVEAMRLLAKIGARLQVLDDAEFLLESCVEFEPENLRARLDYVNVLHRRQKYDKALEQARALRAQAPGRPAFELAYANENLSVGNFDEALDAYDAVIAEYPRLAGTWLARGHALKTVGRTEEAVDSYHRAIEERPDFGDAWWSLANLKTYRFTAAEIVSMTDAEAAPGTPVEDRYHLCFALGKAFEDGGDKAPDYAASFGYYERGNALKKDETNYSSERIEREFRAQREVFDAGFLAARSGQGCPEPDPVFIVGMPRAGSTLLEQILASHSQVDGTMELPNILALAHRLNGRRMVGDEPRYPYVLRDVDAEQLHAFGAKYIEDTRFHRAGAPFFIDKMPNNFRHIGLIHLILPNAKIIDARREPMACCFSNFKQLFAEGQEFTYGLEEVGRYYRFYIELMDHWGQVLPDRVLRVQYEDVVADLETQVRRILDCCGLPFEQSCLEYHATDRAVRTPSAEQVRQPIYTQGLEQWRHFEPFLAPLRDALGGMSSV